MATSMQLTGILTKPDGSIEVKWGNGEVQYFNSADELRNLGAELDDRGDVAQSLLVQWWLARDPNMSNPNLVVGKTLTFDLSVAQPIKVQ